MSISVAEEGSRRKGDMKDTEVIQAIHGIFPFFYQAI